MDTSDLTVWVCVIVMLICVFGCSTMSTKAETVGADGAKQSLIQKDIVAPFAKRADGMGQMSTHLGADGSYDVSTGQHATGTDNTAQGQALAAFMDFAAKLAGSYLGYLSSKPPDPMQPSFLEQIAPLLRPAPVTK